MAGELHVDPVGTAWPDHDAVDIAVAGVEQLGRLSSCSAMPAFNSVASTAGALVGPLGVRAGLRAGGDQGTLISIQAEGDSYRGGQVVTRVTLAHGSSWGWKTGLRTSSIGNAGRGALGWILVRRVKTVWLVVTGHVEGDALS